MEVFDPVIPTSLVVLKYKYLECLVVTKPLAFLTRPDLHNRLTPDPESWSQL